MKTSTFTIIIFSIFLTTAYSSNFTNSQLAFPTIESFSNPWKLEDLRIGKVIELIEVKFSMDQSTLNENSKESLISLATFLKANDSVRIELRGHTNSIPSHKYCDILSEKRAVSIKQYLISLGVNSNNLEAKGCGKRIAKHSNSSSKSRRAIQRVDIKILSL